MPRLVTDLLATLVLPPAGPLLWIAAALLLARRRPRIGLLLAWAGVALAWISASDVVGRALLHGLEPAPAEIKRVASAQAIVVLGGGRVVASPEYGEDAPSRHTLARLRYAAQLARATKVPVLVTGGRLYGGTLAEGVAMARALRSSFGVEARWTEDVARTTWENALGARALLAPEQRMRIALVTSAWHMPRAAWAFRRAGFQVIPAPTDYVTRRPLAPIDWLPSAKGVQHTREALHERLGLLWYRLRGAAGTAP